MANAGRVWSAVVTAARFANSRLPKIALVLHLSVRTVEREQSCNSQKTHDHFGREATKTNDDA